MTDGPEAALIQIKELIHGGRLAVTATSTRPKPISYTGSAVTPRLYGHTGQLSTSAATPPNKDSSPNA
jgi:hypothetical protein